MRRSSVTLVLQAAAVIVLLLLATFAGRSALALLKLGLYLTSDEHAAKVGLTAGFIFKLIILLFYLGQIRSNNAMTPWRQLIVNCYTGSLAGFIWLNEFGILAGREVAYFKFTEVFLLPDLLLQSRNKWYAWPLFLVIAVSLFSQLERDLQMVYSDVLYHCEFSKDLDMW